MAPGRRRMSSQAKVLDSTQLTLAKATAASGNRMLVSRCSRAGAMRCPLGIASEL